MSGYSDKWRHWSVGVMGGTSARPDWASLRVDASDVTPLYHQLKGQIREQSLRLAPETLIPSEKELMDISGVGRATIRRAISDLVQEGVLQTHRGRGTFTARPRIEASLSRPAGFTETMRKLGRSPSTQVVRLERVEAGTDIASHLGVAAGEGVYVIERLRLIDGEPCMIERTHMPERNAPGLIDHDLSSSLYELLSTEYGLVPVSGSESVVAVNADHHLASLLGVPIGSALLATVRVTTTTDGRPFEYTLRHARGDLLAFTVALDSGATLGHRASARPLISGAPG
jgi:GntR family transcriptional regulator